MKLFIGRKNDLWVVDPKKAKIKRLPVSLPTLVFFTLLIIGIGSFSLNLLEKTGYAPKAWLEIIQKVQSVNEIHSKAQELNQLVLRLQQEKEQVTRLNTKLASKIENLEEVLGDVAKDVLESKKLYKPTSIKSSSIPLGRVGYEQRKSIRRLDSIIELISQLPTQSPVRFLEVNSAFGYRNSPNGIGTRFHRGVDLSLKRCDQIFSTGKGVVLKVGYMGGYGLYIDISHGKSVTTRYAHLSKSYVKEGQKVNAKELIGVGGTSGHATGKHLHFEVLVNGRAKNPMLFLSIPQKLQFALKDISDNNKLS